jgi:hypothetical protein
MLRRGPDQDAGDETGRASVLTIHAVDAGARAAVRAFVDLPFRLYAAEPRWVPPFRRDVGRLFDRRAHPFYDHSDAVFFVARRDARVVGRIAVFEPRPFNAHHGTRQAGFTLFECEDDREAVSALVGRAAAWARARALDTIAGPKGFSALDGYGVLVEGFEHRQMMTMSAYNPPHYGPLLEGLGFTKEIDFVSWRLDRQGYVLPERVRRAAEAAERRGGLRLIPFASKRALARAAHGIAEAYNRAFVHNWEYYPLTRREVDFILQQVLLVADHRLIKLIAHGEEIVGFLFAFADVSDALQRARGRLSPLALARLYIALKRSRSVALNGAGILPEYRGRGGNALLYAAIDSAIRASRYEWAELPQVAETAVKMRSDLQTLHAVPIKTHRVYRLAI